MRKKNRFFLYCAAALLIIIGGQSAYSQLTYPRQTVYAGVSVDEELNKSNFFILGYMYEQSISPNFSALIDTGLHFHSGDNDDNMLMIPMSAGMKVNFTRLQTANFFVMATGGVMGVWRQRVEGGDYINFANFGAGIDFSAATVMLRVGSVGGLTPISITAGYAF